MKQHQPGVTCPCCRGGKVKERAPNPPQNDPNSLYPKKPRAHFPPSSLPGPSTELCQPEDPEKEEKEGKIWHFLPWKFPNPLILGSLCGKDPKKILKFIPTGFQKRRKCHHGGDGGGERGWGLREPLPVLKSPLFPPKFPPKPRNSIRK